MDITLNRLLLVLAAVAAAAALVWLLIFILVRTSLPLPTCTQDDIGTVDTDRGRPVSCGCAIGAIAERAPSGCICRCTLTKKP